MTNDKCYEFLRFSLTEDAPVPDALSPEEWRELFDFGVRQAIAGILFLGIEKLPAYLLPPKSVLFKWVSASDEIMQRNILLNKATVNMAGKFRAGGFCCCVLKGQGNALMYPNPHSRTPGDIDIWLCGYADDAAPGGYVYPGMDVMRKRTIDFLKGKITFNDVNLYHANFIYKGVKVEAHYAASTSVNHFLGKRFRRWYAAMGAEQCGNLVTLPDTGGRQIPVPTIFFNLIFQLEHILRHFFDRGIGLKQITDYYELVLQCRFDAAQREKLLRELQYLRLRKFAGAVMWVLGMVYGLPAERMIVPADGHRGRLLLNVIESGGEKGYFDKKYGGIARMSKIERFFTMTCRSLSFFRYYPAEALSEPVYRVKRFFWHNLHGRM